MQITHARRIDFQVDLWCGASYYVAMHYKAAFFLPRIALGLSLCFSLSLAGRDREGGERLKRAEYWILQRNPELVAVERTLLLQTAFEEALRLELNEPGWDPLYILVGFIHVESLFHRYALSSADARGYMQVKPGTATWMRDMGLSREDGHTLFETRRNLASGVDYINYLSREFSTLREVALAYNAGPGALRSGRFVEGYWKQVRQTHHRLKESEGRTMSPLLAVNL